MKSKGTLGTVLTLAVLLAGVAAAEQPGVAKAEKLSLPLYVHVVFFKMKSDAPKDAVEKAIVDCHELLATIPAVKGLRVGRPADKGSPDFLKKDYDFALLVLVENYDGLKAYLEHPQHLKFVERHVKYFDTEKLRVFDFANQIK